LNSYTITGFGTSDGETTLKISGDRGGEVEIFPKPNSASYIVYTLPQTEWETELTTLSILTPDFEYVDQNGWCIFLSNDFGGIGRITSMAS